MVGVPELEVEVLARSAWDTGVFVADEYRRGRVFPAGDAAHRHAPRGGFNGNTGIDLAVHALPRDAWSARTGLPSGGALLVRPDMHVAARSDTGLTPVTLVEVLRTITGSGSPDDVAVADSIRAGTA